MAREVEHLAVARVPLGVYKPRAQEACCNVGPNLFSQRLVIVPDERKHSLGSNAAAQSGTKVFDYPKSIRLPENYTITQKVFDYPKR